MNNQLLDELSVKEWENINHCACEIMSILNEHFDFHTLMCDKVLSQMYTYSLSTTYVCMAQLKEIFKNNPDSIYSRI